MQYIEFETISSVAWKLLISNKKTIILDDIELGFVSMHEFWV
jgi:hypothetical protein